MHGITFHPLQTQEEAEACACMMATSEPWITLKRGYADLLKAVQNPAREVYLAKVEKEIVGLIMINMQGAFTGYIQSICVASKWQNRGIGRQLMLFAEERIFAQTPNVFLCVSSFNTGAQKFYTGLGYEFVGELKDFLVAGYSEILLRKTIAPLVGYDAASLIQKERTCEP
jgi:ribosomal protein S18 acetylase RimI-like enzyme